ncbi:MAG: hypothetical protein HOW73_07805 [Polyangiaceae bacterium]|nr:hypothetical protein [Polyangiaceae bacterium]
MTRADHRGPPLVLALALAGCSGAPSEPSAAHHTNEARARAILSVYTGWTERDSHSPACSVYFAACADSFQRRAGYDTHDLDAKNPRAFMSNPDPEWIPGWDSIPKDPLNRHVTFAALTYAAAMGAHFEDCHKRHQAQEASNAEAMKLFSASKEKLQADPNTYSRLSSLVQLRSELKRNHPRALGARYALELAIHDAFVDSGRELVYHLQSQRAEDAATLRPTLSFRDEEDITCTENLPAWQDPEAVPVGLVNNPLPKERIAELEARIAKSRDLERRIPQKTVSVRPFVIRQDHDPKAIVSIPKDAGGVPLVVVKVEASADGAGLVVELEGKTSVKDAFYGCKEADKPDAVGADGKVAYDTSCKKRDEMRKLHLSVRLAERPDFPIQRGDVLALLGKVESLETKESKQGATTLVEHDARIEGVHVLEIWRRDLLVADYFMQ